MADQQGVQEKLEQIGARSSASDGRQTRPLVGSRSRSRGRTPSELLARKQQLLASDAPEVEARLESLSARLRQQANDEQQQVSPTTATKSIEDVYILLAKKEKDLQLAAELGKALLERNEELSKANERLAEDYSHNLELLEEEKHKLKRKLDQLDGEYENRLIELQTDCNILKKQLEEQKNASKRVEKEKSKLIDDLVQQNQRLTGELVEATKSEGLLSAQLEQVNERQSAHKHSRQDQQVEALKEEISIVNQRKQDFERRLKLAQSDKAELKASLIETSDRVMLLENQLQERDSRLIELAAEVNELRDSSSWLSGRLESMISLNERLAASSLSPEDSSALQTLSEHERARLIEQLRELRLKDRSRPKNIELLARANNNNPMSRPALTQQRRHRRKKHRPPKSANDSLEPSDESHCEEDEEDEQSLPAQIYTLLRNFELTLQQRKESFQTAGSYLSSGSMQTGHTMQTVAEDSGISTTDETNELNGSMSIGSAQWTRLLESLKALIEEMPCSNCQLMIGERADYERLQKLHAKVSDELRKRNEQTMTLEARSIELTAKLKAAEERSAQLAQDLSNCDMPKEEIVALAWRARDEAVARKNNCEINLAKTRIENMQIGSQLMEVVQQKGELSQKLAQFEDDIHYMTQHSVKAKFTWEECAERLRHANNNGHTNNNSNNNNMDNNNGSSKSLASKLLALSPQIGATKLVNSEQPASLMRNFTSNRFNLRFWQKSTTLASASE